MSYISEDQHLMLFVIVATLVTISRLSEWTRVGKALSGTIVIMLLGLLLANFQLLPHRSIAYDQIAIYSVPLAVPLLLLNANMKTIFTKSGTTMLAFVFACLGTFFGAVAGYFLIDMGEFSNNWAGVFAASYTGGTLNFVSVSSALSLPESGISPAIAADTIVGLSYLLLLILLSRSNWLLRFYPPKQDKGYHPEPAILSEPVIESHWFVDLVKLCLAVFLSTVIFILSREIAQFFKVEQFTLLIVTAFALLVANLIPVHLANTKGAFQFGTLLMYGFFFVIAVGTDLQLLLGNAQSFVAFLLVLLAVHVIILGVSAKLLKVSLPELVVASCACIVGPSVAAAVAANRNWVSLVLPGILCGTFGYAIGNFIGVSLAYLLA